MIGNIWIGNLHERFDNWKEKFFGDIMLDSLAGEEYSQIDKHIKHITVHNLLVTTNVAFALLSNT